MMELMDLYNVAEQEDVTVDCFELDAREALSVMDGDGTCFIAIDPMKLQSVQDEKSKLAHELGHCLTGSFYNRYAACDVRKKHENRADKWAIVQLIPRAELMAAMERGCSAPWELAELFDVNEDLVRKAMCWYIHGSLATDLYF